MAEARATDAIAMSPEIAIRTYPSASPGPRRSISLPAMTAPAAAAT
ncbi:MAG TPA: hypothetical protein VGS09_02360 [Actinomycetota bacterium]|nr:hypothetical protein [Actinomycetota bacterium]